ncbi:hypothetical protein F1728_10245 [Gimesia benthica]|uniref:Zinc dependent phospholipase C family protein n=1 Tax=Gimesia benthica TaxID=2608982 RepID=A0A6I6AAA3_9PLAN|nr:hypothetical protein [Gimesia benthica]QGQ23026.1 hypothetical protein F1728_10245 [Gimesia benthica]
MSGIVGHTMYAILGGKAAVQKQLPMASLIHRHYSSYLAGAYMGCDIQIMPEAICVDTGEEVGFGTAPLERSPLTGGDVKPWTLNFQGKEYRPREIHQLFYGRAHVVFGWVPAERKFTVPWDHLPDYAARVFQDARDLYGPGDRQLAYLFGWLAHIVGDSLIKSVQPGITLNLLDGKYTPANRPIQDLVTLHEVGRKELKLDWASLLADLAETPVEPVQLHYMRVSQPRGLLGTDFPDAWAPQHEALLLRVLAENRRYQQIRNPRLMKQYALKQQGTRWVCDEELSRLTGGLSYSEMVALAEKANLRHALWEMGEAVANLFAQVVERVPYLQNLPDTSVPGWEELTVRWKAN